MCEFYFICILLTFCCFVQSTEKGYHLTWSRRELFHRLYASINHSIDSKVNFNAHSFLWFFNTKIVRCFFLYQNHNDGLIIMFWLNMTNYLFACIEKSIFHGYNYERFNGLSLTSERYYNFDGACYVIVLVDTIWFISCNIHSLTLYRAFIHSTLLYFISHGLFGYLSLSLP